MLVFYNKILKDYNLIMINYIDKFSNIVKIKYNSFEGTIMRLCNFKKNLMKK